MGSGVWAGKGDARRRKIDGRRWGLPVDGKRDSDMGVGGGGCAGRAVLGEGPGRPSKAPRKHSKTLEELTWRPR